MLAAISRPFFFALSLSLLFATPLSFAQDVPETSHFEKQVLETAIS
jgi:hypothetical protein